MQNSKTNLKMQWAVGVHPPPSKPSGYASALVNYRGSTINWEMHRRTHDFTMEVACRGKSEIFWKGAKPGDLGCVVVQAQSPSPVWGLEEEAPSPHKMKENVNLVRNF